MPLPQRSRLLFRLSVLFGSPATDDQRLSSPEHSAETLESRLLLTTYVVDDLGDVTDGSDSVADGKLTLREAAIASRLNQDYGDALGGSNAGIDRITFHESLAGGTITLTGDEIDLGGQVSFEGLGEGRLTIDADRLSRHFYTTGRISISDVTLTGGKAPDSGNFGRRGGAIYNWDRLELTRVTFDGNEADQVGGALFSRRTATTVISDSTFVNNLSEQWGGALGAESPLFVTGSTFVGNRASAGGAVAFDYFASVNEGPFPVLIRNSTFTANVATSSGGAIYQTVGELTIVNSTLSGNEAYNGGGIYTRSNSLRIVGSTLTGNRVGLVNSAGRGGAIYSREADWSLELHNSIVAGNERGEPVFAEQDDVFVLNAGMTITGTHNLIGVVDNADGITDGEDGNTVGVDVTTVLDTTLADNGGSTLTHALLADSIAIDAGDSSLATDDGTASGTPLEFDQRGDGFARIRAGAVDIGAVEFDTRPVPGATSEVLGRASDGSWWVAGFSGDGMTSRRVGAFSGSATWEDIVTGDFNGDGRLDAAGRTGGNWWVSLSDGRRFQTSFWGRWSTNVTWVDVSVGDFDGDGLDDIAGRANGTWWVSVSLGDRFATQSFGRWSTSATWRDVRVGDFDGNGASDIAARVGGNWWVALSDGSRFTNAYWGRWSTGTTWEDVTVGDFDGDGRSDLFVRAGREWWVALSAGDRFDSELWLEWETDIDWQHLAFGDFDGDGDDDVAGLFGGAWQVASSSGSEFVAADWGEWPSDNGSDAWTDVVTGDFDGDGRVDVAGRSVTTGMWQVGRSTGSAFTVDAVGFWSPSLDWTSVTTGDVLS